jgi:hypothetical protein
MMARRSDEERRAAPQLRPTAGPSDLLFSGHGNADG